MLTLHDIMSLDVHSATPETTLRELAEMFAEQHISGAPVVSGETVVGVVSATDLLEFDAESRAVPAAREGEWGDWGEPEAWTEGDDAPAAFFADMWADAGAAVTTRIAESGSPEWNTLEERTVGDIMTRTVCALSSSTPVRQAAEYMLRAGVHRVLVMDDGKLVGVVTTTDIMKAVAQHGLGG